MRIMKRWFGLLIGVAFLSAFIATPGLAASPETQRALSSDPTLSFSPDSLLVKFKPAAARAEKQRAYEAVGGGKIRGYGVVRGLEHISLGRGLGPVQAIQRLQRLPFVEYAEPDYIRRADLNDDYYSLQWGLNNTGQSIGGSFGLPGADIDAEDGWTITTGNPDFVVAVIDTGTDYTHPDLNDNIWTNPGEIPANTGWTDDYSNVFKAIQWSGGGQSKTPSPANILRRP